MNHIARLQNELQAANAAIMKRDVAIQAFRVHLDGDKFRGVEPDGSRKDWIAITDVLAWLTNIRDAIHTVEPE